MIGTKSIREELATIVGAENARPAFPDDAICGALPQMVVAPGSEKEVAQILAFADATGLGVAPRGGGTKMDWGNAPRRLDLILSMARIDRILEHAWADLTVNVEAGCTLQALQTSLAKHGQRLAFDGLWPDRATVGGVVAANDSGALRLRFGSLRDLIIGVTLALPDGTLASSGGKVVKNVAGYDLPKLATGALGTLGVITRAVFRLHPLPQQSKVFRFGADGFEAMQRQMLAIQDSKLAHTGLEVHCSWEETPQAEILFEATEAGLGAQEAQLRRLLGSTPIKEIATSDWRGRQDLWDRAGKDSAIGKASVLPAGFARFAEYLMTRSEKQNLQWHMIFQATGIAALGLRGEPGMLAAEIASMRSHLLREGGSFQVQRRPDALRALDGWDDPGDALPLMRAVKRQLDAKNTLNHGRFVGGI
jgi:glycolate oxidase FAD binding subunit